MIKDGRQVSPTLDGIRPDHVARYGFAATVLRGWWPGGAPDPVLDIGCGCGYGASVIVQRTNLNVIAVDIDQGALDYGEAHYGSPRIIRRRMDIAVDALPAAVATTAFEVIEHVEDPIGLLERMPGDVLVGSVPNEELVPFDAAKHHRHFRHYRPTELRDTLAAGGWHALFIGGQTGKHGSGAAVVARPSGCRTLVFEARRKG